MGAYDISTVEGTDPTCFVVPAAHHKFYDVLLFERLWPAHDKQRSDAPVNGIQP